MKNSIRILSFLLAMLLCTSALFACKKEEETSETDAKETTEQESSHTTDQGNDTTETESKDGTGTETETETKEVIKLTDEYGVIIEHAHALENGVAAYYTDPQRSHYYFENLNMSVNYDLRGDNKTVTALKNPSGGVYFENTMDVFVETEDGKVYYSASSDSTARPNIYRMGYYYYDVHFLDQSFAPEAAVTKEELVSLKQFKSCNDITKPKLTADGILIFDIVDMEDPYIATNSALQYDTADFNTLEITMRLKNPATGQLFIYAGSSAGFNNQQSKLFLPLYGDEFYTYKLDLSDIPDYTGNLGGIRLDFTNALKNKLNNDENTVEIKEIKLTKREDSSAPNILLDRTFHTYSDKMNHVAHFVAQENVSKIKSLGVITNIPADRVEKLIVGDKNGDHTSLSEVDWESAVYVAFDIKDAGIFGYILLPHEHSGSLTVTLKDGVYTILQKSKPNGGTLAAGSEYYMGQRIYTDEGHEFDDFLKEAYNERNPLTEIKLLENNNTVSYAGYDALRGAYKFSLTAPLRFNSSYYEEWNRHYTVHFNVKGDDRDRRIYFYSETPGSGTLESAVLLDSKNTVFPIRMEVYKNFGGENEEPVYEAGDKAIGEAIFPLLIKADQSLEFTMLNLYQNWGRFPLKQISAIRYLSPYYHLSTGVTETNCIAPYYVDLFFGLGERTLHTLTDFRSMSAPLWESQPQHSNEGFHQFLQYTTADGTYYASENTYNKIDSAGPVYADVQMDYVSDDGRIKISYTHMEMPETDENRTYYTVRYEILDTIEIADFKNDFSFYTLQGKSQFKKFGYLDEDNQCVVKSLNTADRKRIYTLGKECPYFSLYEQDRADYVNVACLISDWNIVIGGKPYEGNLVVAQGKSRASLSLDLEQVTLQKGDTVSIDMILLPWGSQLSTDDSNVRKVREQTLLDPVKLTAGADTTVIETPFLPSAKSENGKTAEFTISGVDSNTAVRVYGFDNYSVPVIYEKIDGKWVEYKINSIELPDHEGYEHYYDGYYVYYDGNGSFSYAFIIDPASNGRTFRLDTTVPFAGWPEEPVIEDNKPCNVYLDPAAIKEAAEKENGAMGISSARLSQDGSFVSICSTAGKESYFQVYTSSSNKATGQYFVMKFKMPQAFRNFEVFCSTVNAGPTRGDHCVLQDPIYFKGDDSWRVLIIDLSKLNKTFIAATDGSFTATYLRLDLFQVADSSEYQVDLAYVGICDDLNKLYQLNEDMESVVLVDKTGTKMIDPKTGEVLQ